ncbi:MAG: prepilin-type N-terminal cleavage/methylation domain-containing protein [Dehalococcoidales bacterium]|nr:prepilin-type N-terminal cleavage/methylation domain-containing protein [Dehalococcoidales bacterium]
MSKRQKGFTMLELVIGSAIMAVVVGAIAASLITLFLNYGQAAGQSSALPQVQNAGFWISRDVQTSRNVTATDPNGFPLSLRIPVDTDENNDTRADYVFYGQKLKRELYDSSDNLIAETFIADYMDVDNCTFSTVNITLGYYRLTVRATREGEGVTRIYDISQRL